jgi:hypothetical protein
MENAPGNDGDGGSPTSSAIRGVATTGHSRRNSSSSSICQDVRTKDFLRSIQQTTPFESYEESLLMNSLEENDPTGSSALRMEQAVSLPSEFVEEDNGEDDDIILPAARPRLSRTSKSRSLDILPPEEEDDHYNPKTVEEELFDLTKSINKAQKTDRIPLFDPCDQSKPHHRRIRTQQEFFATNAGTIFQRPSSRQQQQPTLDHQASGTPSNSTTTSSSGNSSGAKNQTTTGATGNKDDNNNKDGRHKSSINHHHHHHHGSMRLDKAQNAFGEFGSVLKANRSYIYGYIRSAVLFFILPATIIAFILFYGFENPRFDGIIDDINSSANRTSTIEAVANPKGKKNNGDASWSWWLLFFVRHVITWGAAKAIQFLVVSMAQNPTPTQNRKFCILPQLGPIVRLIILQEKGLPMQLQIWGILNFIVNHGTSDFAEHWMYYQDFLVIFTDENPSGGVTYNPGYRNLLLFSIFAGASVAAKRFLVGLRFGKASYDRYATKLTGVLEDIVDLTRIAKFAHQMIEPPPPPVSSFASLSSLPQNHPQPAPAVLRFSPSAIAENTATINEWMGRSAWSKQDDAGVAASNDKDTSQKTNVDLDTTAESATMERMEEGAAAAVSSSSSEQPILLQTSEHQTITDSQRIKIDQLLGEWEDLDVAERKAEDPSLSSIVQFRASCQVLDSPFPFSQAFGYARNRYEVIECSQRLYTNLMEIQRYLEDMEYGSSSERTATKNSNSGSLSRSGSEIETSSSASSSSTSSSFPFLQGQRPILNPSRIPSTESNKTANESSSYEYHPVLRFQTLALTLMNCKKKKGIGINHIHGNNNNNNNNRVLDQLKAKKLISMFRPARNGDITLLEFCKSIDMVYKDMRKLRASIANEGRMNMASEKILNVIFYCILAWAGVAAIGINPLALLGFLGSIIISISFMVGGASSDYFRGLLFILVQRPYDIGDRINVNGIETDANPNGSPGWIVKDVTLYHTTVIYGTTQEYATYSNGALSGSRIINCARSPQAVLNFCMKFGLDTPHPVIEEFHTELKAYVKSKPREWLAFSAFRLNSIEADLGYVEYKILIQHRDSWQNIAALVTDLADVRQFAVNLSKTKGMTYQSPPLPVEMKFGGNAEDFLRRQQELLFAGKKEGDDLV